MWEKFLSAIFKPDQSAKISSVLYDFSQIQIESSLSINIFEFFSSKINILDFRLYSYYAFTRQPLEARLAYYDLKIHKHIYKKLNI